MFNFSFIKCYKMIFFDIIEVLTMGEDAYSCKHLVQILITVVFFSTVMYPIINRIKNLMR